jgi:hypothetical protein
MEITEDYVSFEVAKLLKEKGFDVECNTYFISDDEIAAIPIKRDFNNHGIYLSAPTLQMVMKWLREVHGLFISIGNDGIDYNWQIINVKDRTNKTYLTEPYAGYGTYEKAVEGAIKYCLTNYVKNGEGI